MSPPPDGPQWRGWDRTSAGTPGLVTSRRLGADAPVQNRIVPKGRSWFALGEPLELLSPLSVLRIVLILFVAVGIAVLVAAPSVHLVPVVAVVALAVATLVGLTRVTELGPRNCIGLGAGAVL